MGDEQAEQCNILGPKPSSGSAPEIFVISLLTVLIVHPQAAMPNSPVGMFFCDF